MSVDFYLQVDGIKGESADSAHKDWITIHSWSLGASQSGTGATNTGSGAGKVSYSDLSIMKDADLASAPLLLACSKGTHIAKVKLEAVKAGGAGLPFFTVELSEVLVSSYQTSGSSEVPSESISLNFSKINFQYTQQGADGKAGLQPKMTWDLKANKGS